jgi:hypothetical protein
MQNEPWQQDDRSGNFGPGPEPKETAAEDAATRSAWLNFQRELDTLGRQLSDLRTHTAALGETLIGELQTRFADVRTRASELKQLSDKQVEALREAARRQAEEMHGAYGEARIKSREAARQMWERSEPFRQGAKDVGEGLVRAWGELRSSFGKAAGRMQGTAGPAQTPNAPVPPPTDKSNPPNNF